MAKKFEIVAEYKGYDVVKSVSKIAKVKAGDILTSKGHTESWKLGSVISYSLEYNQDPIASYALAVKNGHSTHWANAMGASITSNPSKGPRKIEVDYGQVIQFEGKFFRIDQSANNNIELVEVKESEID